MVWHRALLWLFMPLLVQAQSDNWNYWIVPPNEEAVANMSLNQVYELGETIQLQWVTNYTQLSLYLHHWSEGGAQAVPGYQNITPIETLNWTATYYNFHYGASHSFKLTIVDEDGRFADTHYFNLTTNAVSPTTSSAENVAPTPAPVAATSSFSPSLTLTPSPSTTVISGGSKEDGSNSGSHTADAHHVALGLGLGLGIPLIVTIAGTLLYCFWWRPRKQQKRQLIPSPTIQSPSNGPNGLGTSGPFDPRREESEALSRYLSRQASQHSGGGNSSSGVSEMTQAHIGFQRSRTLSFDRDETNPWTIGSPEPMTRGRSLSLSQQRGRGIVSLPGSMRSTRGDPRPLRRVRTDLSEDEGPSQNRFLTIKEMPGEKSPLEMPA